MRIRNYILTVLLIIITLFLVWLITASQRTAPSEQKPIGSIPTTGTTPTFHISKGQTPPIPLQLPPGYTIHIFANDLGGPRDLVFSPGGTLLVSNPNSNEVIALPDKNNDGVTDAKKVIISGENHPHGLAFYNGKLFVADVNRVVRYNWDEQSLQATFDKTLFSLPNNNNHNNRTITFDQKGTMYVSIGSTCNVCVESSPMSATVMASNSNGDNPRIFAEGLRNASFTQVHPQTGELWSTEMGRDFVGDNAPPDEIDIIRQGRNYGWPYCYGNKVHDNDFDPGNNHSCIGTEPPIYEIPAHSAPLGLTFIKSSQFPTDWQNDLLVAYHGSWNRSVPTGYKVVHMKVSGNTITQADDFLTGFLQNGTSLGRPVDVIFDESGNLYISDDKAGAVYILQKTP